MMADGVRPKYRTPSKMIAKLLVINFLMKLYAQKPLYQISYCTRRYTLIYTYHNPHCDTMSKTHDFIELKIIVKKSKIYSPYKFSFILCIIIISSTAHGEIPISRKIAETAPDIPKVDPKPIKIKRLGLIYCISFNLLVLRDFDESGMSSIMYLKDTSNTDVFHLYVAAGELTIEAMLGTLPAKKTGLFTMDGLKAGRILQIKVMTGRNRVLFTTKFASSFAESSNIWKFGGYCHDLVKPVMLSFFFNRTRFSSIEGRCS